MVGGGGGGRPLVGLHLLLKPGHAPGQRRDFRTAQKETQIFQRRSASSMPVHVHLIRQLLKIATLLFLKKFVLQIWTKVSASAPLS